MYRQTFQNSHEEIHIVNIDDPNTQCKIVQIPKQRVSKLTANQKYKNQKHKQKMVQKAKKRQIKNNKSNKNRFLKCYSDRFVRFLLTGIFISMFLCILFLMFHQKSEQFNIYLKIQGDQQIRNVLISKLGLDQNPQVGSYMDYFNITKNRKYMKFKENYLEYFTYKTYGIDKNYLEYFTYKTYGIDKKYLKMQDRQQNNQYKKEKVQKKQNKIKSQQVQNYIFKKYVGVYHQKFKNQPNNIQTTFKNLQGLNQQQKDKIQQYYVNLAYNTSHQTTQTPLCIVSYNFHTFNQNIYQSFFTSIFKQKFNSYKLILIDDKSQDNSSQKIIKLFQDRFNKYQHLVTIVRNDKYLGKIGSYFIHAQNCKQNQVIVYLEIGYTVVGKLSFAIISNTFKDLNIWLAYSDIIQENADNVIKQDKKLKIPISQIRTSLQKWQFPQVFAARKILLTKITIQQLIQYSRIQKNIYLPQFYDSKQNIFLIYPLLQLCGVSHLLFLQQLLFIHNNRQPHLYNNTHCIFEKQKVNNYKLKLKYSLKKLENLSQNQQLQPISEPSLMLVKQLKQQYQEYLQCMKNINKQIKPTLRIKKQIQKEDSKF